MNRKQCRLFSLALLALPLAGCGGSATPSRAAGMVRFTVKWPTKPSRVIPVSAQSIQVTVYDSQGQQIAQKLLVRPSSVVETGHIDISNVTAGTVRVDAAAYPTTDGSGVKQGAGTVTVNVIAGQIASADMTMDSTVTHLKLIALPQLNVGQTTVLQAQALDANGNEVITDVTEWAWSTDGTVSGYASFTSSGNTAMVHGISPGPYAITADFVGTDVSQSDVFATANINIVTQSGSIDTTIQ